LAASAHTIKKACDFFYNRQSHEGLPVIPFGLPGVGQNRDGRRRIRHVAAPRLGGVPNGRDDGAWKMEFQCLKSLSNPEEE